MPTSVKITTRNIKGLDSLLAPSDNGKTQWRKDRRKEAVAEQVAAMAPDVLCVQEGPRGEAKVDALAAEVLGGPDHLRWTVDFGDFIEPDRDTHILLDHILFTQGLVDGSLPLRIGPGAGLVEHEAHQLVNTSRPKYAHTSDHRPVSVIISVDQ